MDNRLLMGLLINGRGQMPKYKQRSTINRTIMSEFLGVGSGRAEELCRKCGADPYATAADWSQMKPDAWAFTGAQVADAILAERERCAGVVESCITGVSPRDYVGAAENEALAKAAANIRAEPTTEQSSAVGCGEG